MRSNFIDGNPMDDLDRQAAGIDICLVSASVWGIKVLSEFIEGYRTVCPRNICRMLLVNYISAYWREFSCN